MHRSTRVIKLPDLHQRILAPNRTQGKAQDTHMWIPSLNWMLRHFWWGIWLRIRLGGWLMKSRVEDPAMPNPSPELRKQSTREALELTGRMSINGISLY